MGRAFGANELFRLEFLCSLLRRFAIFHAAEVRVLALEALVVGEFEERVVLQVLVVRAVRVVQCLHAFLTLVNSFVLGALE